MKRIVFSMMVVMGILFSISIVNVRAQSLPQFLYDINEENGKMISKQVYKLDEATNTHEPYLMREFTYTDSGNINTFKTLRWNKKDNSWNYINLATYEYDNALNTVTIHYALWDKKTNKFNVPKQKVVYQLSENKDATYFTQYEKSSLKGNWDITKRVDLKQSTMP